MFLLSAGIDFKGQNVKSVDMLFIHQLAFLPFT